MEDGIWHKYTCLPLGSILSHIQITMDLVHNQCYLYFSASMLGIHISYTDHFGGYEIMKALEIDCPLALLPIHSNRIQCNLWVSVSFDHVCIVQQSQDYTSNCFMQAGNEPEEYDGDELAHQIRSYDLLFLPFYHFPSTTNPPPCTMPTWPSTWLTWTFATAINYTLYPLHYQSGTPL